MNDTRTAEALAALKQIRDPDLGNDIVTLGFIKDLRCSPEGRVSFTLELTTPACPVKEHFKAQCERILRALPWVTGVEILVSARPPAASQNPLLARSPGIEKVRYIVAVSSCKGGVGKSTVAVNLAYALRQLGGSIGLFDADVYGPSLPTLVRTSSTELYLLNELIQPLEHEGVRLMSFGFIPAQAGGGGPAIMRGPMVTQVIQQLLMQTDWGNLDYLVIDMPPGTGDIQLTLTQILPITAAVIVTTPQQLSFVDVVKGIQMFDKLKVPTVAVVENMSYFVCPDSGKRYYVFGQGARRRLVEQFGIKNSFEIPIEPEISRLSDAGTPVVLAAPESEAAGRYREIAAAVVQEIAKLEHGGWSRPKVAYNPARGIVLTLADGEEKVCAPAAVRRACRCAHCVEEFSGKPLLDPASVPESIYPRSIVPMGNYAVAIVWSDGHSSSIYPYEQLLALSTGS